jgi:hypothetical protein
MDSPAAASERRDASSSGSGFVTREATTRVVPPARWTSSAAATLASSKDAPPPAVAMQIDEPRSEVRPGGVKHLGAARRIPPRVPGPDGLDDAVGVQPEPDVRDKRCLGEAAGRVEDERGAGREEGHGPTVAARRAGWASVCV